MVLPATDRSSLINDAFALAGAGDVSYSVPLRLASYLSAERHYIPWKTAVDELTALQYRLRYTELYGDFRGEYSSLTPLQYRLRYTELYGDFRGEYSSLTSLQYRLRYTELYGDFRGEYSSLTALQYRLRYTELYGDFKGEYSSLTALQYRVRYTELYGDFRGKYSSLTAVLQYRLRYTELYGDFRKYILELVGPHFDSLGWEDVGSHLEKRNRVQLLKAACRAGHPGCLQGAADALQQWLDDPQHYISPNLRSLVYKYGMEQISEAEWESYLVPRFSLNERYLGFMVPRITRHFDTQLQLDEMRQFFARYPEAGAGERSRREALETTQANINWLKNHRDELARWLAERS
ncbi:Glutamyl aminopeptidase [Amphibalanus amphitrite]|uniref:Glutamyl aminopeptidase n=1 Tax=Amphibalanus amphitrite TaxID=1232801 RepID=A0A6A4VI17_AMPAM|nr:Glutamyl aminopeptidase [Amphibalanus amphitrite]